MPIEKYGDAASLQTLRSLVQPFILRRLIAKSFKTCQKSRKWQYFAALAEQAELYQRVVEVWLKLNQLKDCNVGGMFGFTCEAQTNL